MLVRRTNGITAADGRLPVPVPQSSLGVRAGPEGALPVGGSLGRLGP
jgi:hypothetical protein